MQLSAVFAVFLFNLALGKIYETVDDLVPNLGSYDYVVVGGGTAGLVVANRLSASGSFKVLVLEAGGSDYGQEDLQIPLLALSIPTATNAAFDWNYTTTPQVNYNNRAIPYPRGYVLGGCSSTNYMVYNRGTQDDWNYYAAATQDQGWSWDSMSPFFANTEHFIPSSTSSENAAGYLPSAHFSHGAVDVSLPSYFWPSDQRVIETTQQLAEFPYQQDYNAGTTLGVGWLQATIGNGARASASTSYIHPVIDSRPNLDILLNAKAVNVVRTGTKNNLPFFGSVIFVFQPTGQTYVATAAREIILSAGVFNTPQILMLSGIGAPSELQAAGMSTIVALPSVGKNMSDHVLLINVFTTTSSNTWANYTNPTVLQQQKSSWETTRQGPLSDPPANTVGWMRLPADDNLIQKHGDPSTGPTSAHWEFLVSEGFVPGLLDSSLVSPNMPALTISTALLSPTSRGTVGLNNANPVAAPILNPNWLHTDIDLHIMRYAVQAIQRFIDAPAWQGFNLTPYGPFNGVRLGSDLGAYITNNSETLWHACGTAAMSPFGAKYGVVNPDLSVKGTSGLRVVDASALPRVPSGHPQGVIYAMAERASSLILAASGSN